MSTQETKKVVYSLDLLRLQLPGCGQASSVQLCTKGRVRHEGRCVASTQPELNRKEASKETNGGRVCLSGPEVVWMQGGAPSFRTSVTLAKPVHPLCAVELTMGAANKASGKVRHSASAQYAEECAPQSGVPIVLSECGDVCNEARRVCVRACM